MLQRHHLGRKPDKPRLLRDATLTYLGRVSSPGDALRVHHLFDAVHFLLVAFAVFGRRFLGGPQGSFQSFDTFSRSSEAFLQLGQLAAEVGVVLRQLEEENPNGSCDYQHGNISTGMK